MTVPRATTGRVSSDEVEVSTKEAVRVLQAGVLLLSARVQLVEEIPCARVRECRARSSDVSSDDDGGRPFFEPVTIRNGNVRLVIHPIAITGFGVVSPFGDSPGRFRDALLDGATAIAADPRFVSFGCRSTLAARVSGFDPAEWIAPMKLRRMDTTGPYALVAMRQAMEDANYPVTTEGDARAGIVLGTYSAGGQATNEYLEALFRGGPTGAPALLFNSTVGNAAAGLAGLEYKLCGPNATISQKEASGLAAIAAAVDVLRLGRADAVGAGGMDAIYDLFYRAHDRFA